MEVFDNTSDRQDIHIAKKYFASKSIVACNFDKKTAGKKPDLELFKNSERIAFCEVKALRSESFGTALIDRRPPVYNKIETKIRESSQKFIESNPDHLSSNIILFVNYHSYDSAAELRGLLKGLSGGNNLQRLEKGNFLSNLDLMIWVDKEQKTAYPLFPSPLRHSNPPVKILQEIFGDQEQNLPDSIFAN